MSHDRRMFLKTSVASGLAVAAPAILGAAENSKSGKKYRTALIGTGWWGMNILREAIASGECEVVALCDVDRRHLDNSGEEVEKLCGDKPKRFKDYRELLDAAKPEIAIVATADHWHPLITIAACKAGAHVFVEKPVGHTIYEGRAMVKAARETDRVVQVGTHRRVSPHNVAGMEMLRSGAVGKVGMIRAFVHYGGGPETPQANEDPPPELDWEMWCGPAPLRPYNRKIHPRGFRGFLDYANGTLGDWGIHWMDQILWWSEEQWPQKVFSTGGRPIAGPVVHDGKQQTTDAPDHQLATFQFENFSVSWEHRRFAANHAEKTHPGQAVGCYFYGTKGTLHIGWLDGTTFYPVGGGEPTHVPPQLNQPDHQNIKELWADLLDAIKNKRRPVCDIEHGHRSTTLSLLGMLSLRLGRSVDWDGEREVVLNDDEANALLKRPYRGEWQYPDYA